MNNLHACKLVFYFENNQFSFQLQASQIYVQSNSLNGQLFMLKENTHTFIYAKKYSHFVEVNPFLNKLFLIDLMECKILTA